MKNLIYYNLKLISKANILVAVVFLMVISLMLNMNFLDYNEAANIGEFYISIIGIIIFPYLCTIEYNQNIKETIFTKKTSFTKVVFIRIILIAIFMLLCTSAITVIQVFNGGDFKAIELITGICITIFFLGMLGITVSNIFENEMLGYMVAFMYYFFDRFSVGKYTKDLYLFSLTKGSFIYGKWWILLISLVLLAVNLIILKRKS